MTLRFEADLEAAAESAAAWSGEPFLHDGEDAAVALATGTVRRAALDAALEQINVGALYPSFEWRRDYALVLGLERVLSESQPKLASGTTLRRHQVDALAGQLAALIGDLQRVEPDENGVEEEDDDEETGEIELAEVVEEDEEFDDDYDEDEDEFEDDEDEDDDDEDEDGRSPRAASSWWPPIPRWSLSTTSTTSSTATNRRLRIPAPAVATGSSTRPPPVRRSRRQGLWRPLAPPVF